MAQAKESEIFLQDKAKKKTAKKDVIKKKIPVKKKAKISKTEISKELKAEEKFRE